MAKKKTLKITPVLVTLNIIVLLLIVGFYTFRLVKYYLKENGHKVSDTVLLVDEVKKHQSYVDQTKGLVLDDETGVYTYKGEVKDNYINYSGMMFRIVSIDTNGNLKLVSEDNVTIIYPGFNNGYEKSYVNKWLNSSEEENSGIYEDILINSGGLLDKSEFCMDVIDDTSNIQCNDVNNDMKITLLSLYDYKMAGGSNSYLNNGEQFNLGTLDSNNYNYYVTEEGGVSLNQRPSRAITIKPVITINSGTELISGSGKKDDPYIIEKHDIETLEDVYVNNIIKIDNYNYKVIGISDDKVKVTTTDTLSENDDELKIAFGGTNSAFGTNNTVYKYLNDTYLNSLSIKDKIVKSDWYIGTLNLSNLDYSSVSKSKVSANVGMLTIGDMYINDVNNVFTLLRGMEASNIINVINEDGNLFADSITSKYGVRPAFYLESDIIIKSGNGTIDSPYILGDSNE